MGPHAEVRPRSSAGFQQGPRGGGPDTQSGQAGNDRTATGLRASSPAAQQGRGPQRQGSVSNPGARDPGAQLRLGREEGRPPSTHPKNPSARPAHRGRGLGRNRGLRGLHLGLSLHLQAAQFLHLDGPGYQGGEAGGWVGGTHQPLPAHADSPGRWGGEPARRAPAPFPGRDQCPPQLRLARLTSCHSSVSRKSSARPASCGSGCRFPCSRQCLPYRDSMALGREQRQRPLVMGAPPDRAVAGGFRLAPGYSSEPALPGFQTASNKPEMTRWRPGAGRAGPV